MCYFVADGAELVHSDRACYFAIFQARAGSELHCLKDTLAFPS